MFDFSKIPESLKFGGRMERSLRRSFARAVALFSGEGADPGANDPDEAARRRMVLSLARTVLGNGETVSEREADSFRQLLADDFPPIRIERMVASMRQAPTVTAEEAAPLFASRPDEERERLVRMLLILAVGNDGRPESFELIDTLALRLGFSAEEMKQMRADVVETHRRRARILRSGAGMLVALIVIAVFVLTATLLRSVIFGLIIAYLMLPLEKYFERRLRQHRGLGNLLFRAIDFVSGPLRKLAASIQRRHRTGPAPEAEEKRRERQYIARAVTLTCGVMLIFAILFVSGLSALTRHYVKNLKGWTRTQVENVAAHAQPAPTAAVKPQTAKGNSPESAAEAAATADNGFWTSEATKLIGQGQVYLERLRERFETLPLVKWGLDQIDRILNDESAQRELAGFLLQRTGGLFSFTAGVLGTVGVILIDLLLTVFFFLLFLMKLAEFCGPGDGPNRKRQSEYLVRTVFNGSWLPGASPETMSEAQRIIGEVINKLRTWVRGYLTLVIVDATVYTTCFFFLGVPYFPILGMLAGCGILLPYLGPILSATVTILITLAVGGSSVSGAQLAGIVAAYLIYNGVIEQFILYPAVIGESLGLSTLETIIVVLLGAIFAGIPGMILALPAASVIKYLVPQIYHAWGASSRPPEKEE